jgi:hypothetical protein
MFRYLFKKLEELLLPERQAHNGAGYLEPVDALRLIYQQISQLAQQIESHAETAPYPQVAQRLRLIANEKRDIGNRLKQIIEKLHGSLPEQLQFSGTGKNHWQRLIQDLEDQKELDDRLSRYEFALSRQLPEITNFLQELKTMHETHRQSLTQLIAVADPQAAQT